MQEDTSPGGFLRRGLGLGLLASLLSVFVGLEIGELTGRRSSFEAAHAIQYGRIAGGIYGALFAFVPAWVAAHRGYRWRALLIGLVFGALGAALGGYIETH